jgi:hypothetical protein
MFAPSTFVVLIESCPKDSLEAAFPQRSSTRLQEPREPIYEASIRPIRTNTLVTDSDNQLDILFKAAFRLVGTAQFHRPKRLKNHQILHGLLDTV